MEETENQELRCPCKPQCPNYGKCRQCIAAHARFNTPPFCVKRMLEDMKKNHRHPSSPHIRKPLPERVAEYYRQNPGAHLRTAAADLKITEWQLLDAYDRAVPVPVPDLEAVCRRLSGLDRVLLHVDTGSLLLQVETRLPVLSDMKGIQVGKTAGSDISLTSLLFQDTIYALFLVRETLYGKESASLAIINDADEKIALSIYLPHDGEDQTRLQPAARAVFDELWNQYATQKGETS